MNSGGHQQAELPITQASRTSESLKEDGVFWPCPDLEHPGTPRFFLDRFATPDGQARFHPVEFRPAAEEPDHDFPLYLTTGRIMAQYQSGTQTRRVAGVAAGRTYGFRADSSRRWLVRMEFEKAIASA